MSADELINVGEISGVFGVKGWIKVFSFTQPRENILSYSPWYLQKGDEIKQVKPVDGQRQGKLVVASLFGVNDRDQALLLGGWKILIDRGQLPVLGRDEYYWSDLIGLKVKTPQGVKLGVVVSMMETGANDVLVVREGEKERLIPFIQQHTVMDIDLDLAEIIVDWDPEF